LLQERLKGAADYDAAVEIAQEAGFDVGTPEKVRSTAAQLVSAIKPQ